MFHRAATRTLIKPEKRHLKGQFGLFEVGLYEVLIYSQHIRLVRTKIYINVSLSRWNGLSDSKVKWSKYLKYSRQ